MRSRFFTVKLETGFGLLFLLKDGKILVCPNQVYAGANKTKLVYTHPTSKQCNYNVDTSNLVTKDELEKVKGMIEVSAKIVGSGTLSIYGTAGNVVESSMTVSVDYDFVELVLIPFTPSSDNSVLTPYYSTKVLKGYNGSIVIKHNGINSTYECRVADVSATANKITARYTVENRSTAEATYSVVFYKY